mgnify:CR=1 FL=1
MFLICLDFSGRWFLNLAFKACQYLNLNYEKRILKLKSVHQINYKKNITLDLTLGHTDQTWLYNANIEQILNSKS